MDAYERRGYNYSSRPEMPPNRHEDSPHSYTNGYNSDQLSDSNDEGPTYLLEHLATFTVGPPHGIQQPSDGLRRLLQMEKTTGIWTQKMQLRLEKKWIVIIDFENGDVVERFPMHLISDPTAFTNTELKNLYNNVLVFIVREDPRKKNVNPAEMHIFQCVRVSAQDVVGDMKLFMAGKWKLGFGKSDSHQIPPPPNNPPPEPPANGVNVRQQVSRINAFSSNYSQRNEMHSSQNSHPSPVSHNSHLLGNRTGYGEATDETSSTSSEKYERDVTILNCCFDDIERFIGRLQSAAAAFRELERRRRTRKGKKKDHGEGMLSMRAKPPPEREFVDILQKFKLSFNLLAKLKSHIHDPNAPELVHFLFTPLALIMDASRDSNYGPNLASKVVSPLLTREAVDLLTNCLTSKESDLWHSLGDAWTIPRDQWKDYVSPYHPVFSNGWAPDYPFSEDRERAEITAVAAASAAQRARREEILKAQHDAEVREQEYQRGPIPHNDSRYSSSYYYNNDRVDRPSPSPSVEDRRQHFDPSYDGHIEETRGFNEREHTRSPHSDRDYVEHRDRDGRSDISADSIERSPLDPHRQFDRHQRNWLEELKARGSKIVQVTYPRTANNDKELTVFRGEYLEVLDDSRKWWKTRNARGQIAHVPHTIVTPYQPGDEDAIFNNPLYARSSRESFYGQDSPNRSTDGSFSGERPPFRIPSVPTPTPAPAERIRKERQGKKGEFRYF
uniref:Epidermal growth factor receptor kinase substrate 8 n=1 Tax=Scolopendra viridis TaxID=118503 RepID=A0A4D5R947_SCOVI